MSTLFDDLPETPKAKPKIEGSRAWAAAVEVLTRQGGLTDGKARTFIGKLKKQKLSDQDLLSIANGAKEAGTMDPISYFTRAATEAVQRRAAPTEIEAPSEARQIAWMKDWKENPAGWRRHERGPPPGEPGCRVSIPVQARFR